MDDFVEWQQGGGCDAVDAGERTGWDQELTAPAFGGGDQSIEQGVVAEGAGRGDGEGWGMIERGFAPDADGLAPGGLGDKIEVQAGQFVRRREQLGAWLLYTSRCV